MASPFEGRLATAGALAVVLAAAACSRPQPPPVAASDTPAQTVAAAPVSDPPSSPAPASTSAVAADSSDCTPTPPQGDVQIANPTGLGTTTIHGAPGVSCPPKAAPAQAAP